MSVATVEAGHEGMPEHFWVPLVDGSERLGVVEVQVIKTVVDWPGLVARCERFVDVLAHIVIAKWSYGDTLVRLRRTRPMTAGGELLLSMLPPLTYTCSDMVISAVLEPAYEVGGDAFDYAVDGRVARLLVLDAMGHGLSAASTSTVALAAIRAARRNGGGLHAMATAADAALTQQFPDLRYVTGVLAELHLDSGMLRYINAGHPQPILIRGGHTVQQLGDGRRLPLGMQDNFLEVGMQSMSRGDRLLLYTDGIIEARDYAGGPFGVTRLIDLLRRTTSYGFPAPETLRRLSHNVIARQPGPPADDATLLLLQWSHQAALKAIP